MYDLFSVATNTGTIGNMATHAQCIVALPNLFAAMTHYVLRIGLATLWTGLSRALPFNYGDPNTAGKLLVRKYG